MMTSGPTLESVIAARARKIPPALNLTDEIRNRLSRIDSGLYLRDDESNWASIIALAIDGLIFRLHERGVNQDATPGAAAHEIILAEAGAVTVRGIHGADTGLPPPRLTPAALAVKPTSEDRKAMEAAALKAVREAASPVVQAEVREAAKVAARGAVRGALTAGVAGGSVGTLAVWGALRALGIL